MILVFETDYRHDVILGWDFLTKVGVNLTYKERKVEWLGNTIPMESLSRPNALAAHVDSYLMQIKNDDFDLEDIYKAWPILDAKYERVDVEEVADNGTHLNQKQRKNSKP